MPPTPLFFMYVPLFLFMHKNPLHENFLLLLFLVSTTIRIIFIIINFATSLNSPLIWVLGVVRVFCSMSLQKTSKTQKITKTQKTKKRQKTQKTEKTQETETTQKTQKFKKTQNTQKKRPVFYVFLVFLSLFPFFLKTSKEYCYDLE